MRTDFVVLTWCAFSHARPCVFEFNMNDKIFETWFDLSAPWSKPNTTAGDVVEGLHIHALGEGDTILQGLGCASLACLTERLRDAMIAQQKAGCAASDIAMPMPSAECQIDRDKRAGARDGHWHFLREYAMHDEPEREPTVATSTAAPTKIAFNIEIQVDDVSLAFKDDGIYSWFERAIAFVETRALTDYGGACANAPSRECAFIELFLDAIRRSGCANDVACLGRRRLRW